MTQSSFQEKTAAAKKLFGAAAKLAQKQAELAKLNNVTLPKLYHAIGKHLVGLEKIPAELEHHRKRIRELEAGIAATPEAIKSDPAGGFAAKAKQFAQQAAQKTAKATGDAAATLQIQKAYVALGKDATEKHGDKACPKLLADELRHVNDARNSLQEAIRDLKHTSHFDSMSRNRILYALAGVACLGFTGIYLLTSQKKPASNNSQDEVAESWGRDLKESFAKSFSEAAAIQDTKTPPAASAKVPGKASQAVDGLPPELERHRNAVVTLKHMYEDAGQPNVSAKELARAMQVLAGGTMLNRRKAQVEELMNNLRDFRANTGRSMEQVIEEMAAHIISCRSNGLDDAYAENSYTFYLKDTPARTDNRPKMICPTCKGTGNADPDNPGRGGFCLLCAGSGMRKVGQ
jgi:hypothetical protein